MPSRIIHDKCRKSLSLDALSAEAERLFWRLTTAADDYGRFDANPRVLLGECFPYKIEIFKSSEVEKWRDELTREHVPDEPPLVRLYTLKGRTYGHFVKWTDYQRDRSQEKQPPKPKFPAPEEGELFTPGYAAVARKSPQAPPVSAPAPKPAKPAAKADLLTPKFLAFWEAYPARSGRRVGRALCAVLFNALSEEDQDLCIGAAKEYARNCVKEERTPRDPERFFRGRQGEVWRDFIPAPPTPQRRPLSAVTPQPAPPVCDAPPPEAMAALRKILPTFSVEGQA